VSQSRRELSVPVSEYLYVSDGLGQSNPQMAKHVYIVYFICHLEQKSNALYANRKNQVTGNLSICQCCCLVANVSGQCIFYLSQFVRHFGLFSICCFMFLVFGFVKNLALFAH